MQEPDWGGSGGCLTGGSPWAVGGGCGSPSLLPCPLQVGFVNSLKFSAAGDFLVAGIGQEHRYHPPSPALPMGPTPPSSGAWRRVTPIPFIYRLGRWWRVKEAKNSICIIPLRRRVAAPTPEAPASS